jgi:hypothetical protein
MDFSAWVKNEFTPDDNIIAKSNIEGAEYPIFEKMMFDGTAGYIKRLFLRRHWNKIGMPKEMDESFLARLSEFIPVIESEYRFA